MNDDVYKPGKVTPMIFQEDTHQTQITSVAHILHSCCETLQPPGFEAMKSGA